jgi:hypothetical protein
MSPLFQVWHFRNIMKVVMTKKKGYTGEAVRKADNG